MLHSWTTFFTSDPFMKTARAKASAAAPARLVVHSGRLPEPPGKPLPWHPPTRMLNRADGSVRHICSHALMAAAPLGVHPIVGRLDSWV
jgi:hypothetical protein